MRRVVSFLIAVFVAYVLLAVSYTQLNLANFVEMGIDLSMQTRLQATGADLLGMAPFFLPVTAFALLIGFGFAKIAARFIPQLRTLAFVVSGFVAMFLVDFVTRMPFGTHIIPTTRTTIGLLAFCIAGAVGAYVYIHFTSKDEVIDGA